MFYRLGQLVSQRPWYVIAVWVVLAAIVVATAPKLTSTSDESEFLPEHYESVKAMEMQAEAFPDDHQMGAIIVFDRDDGEELTDGDIAEVEHISGLLKADLGPAFEGIDVQEPAENRLVQLAVVGLAPEANGFDPDDLDSVTTLRNDLSEAVQGTDLHYGVTGGLAQALDSQDASENAEKIVGVATVALIVVLLLIIFRSPIIALLPIIVIAVVSQVATGLIAFANDIFGLKADNSVQVVLIVVLYGIGTDYILFFLFRYRERLRSGAGARDSVAHGIARAGEAITSAGGAVIVAFMALVLSSLSIFRSIGPALAIAVAVTVVAATTLVPAIVALLGTKVFWPSKAWQKEPESARFAAVGRSLGKHPVRYAAASGIALAVLAVFAIGFKPTFDLTDTGVPSDAESTVALKTLEQGLPAGAMDPTSILVRSEHKLDQADMKEYTGKVGHAEGVAAALPGQISADHKTMSLSLYLADDPASDAALDHLDGPIRETAHDAAPDGSTALVGGTTSVYVDLQDAMNRDYSVVFPVAAIVIMVILALLLRSLVAPWYLMASVGLGFGATLGATVIVFQHIGNLDGLIFMLPIYIYLFVVALGTDYNILMIARLREEARQGYPARDAAARSLRYAGPTVAAAGVILAGTFASLMLGGNALLTSMGFAISFGIVIAAFVMSMFFTPALTALIGHAAWWPGRSDEGAEAEGAEPKRRRS